MKQIVVVKGSKTQVNIFSDYLCIKKNGAETIIAYRHIKELYLNKLIDISIADSIRLSKIFDTYFTDQYGNILAKVQLYEKV